MATLQNIGKLKYRGKDGLWHPLPVVVQDAGGGVSTISGKGAPTSETQGEVNQLYRDEDTQKLYICTATDGGYTWAEVSGGGSVDVDATLTKAGQAADAKATGDAIGKKIDKAQGTGNAGKILGIGADGNVTPQEKPVKALAGASAPTTATAGVVGQEYYVIVGNAVTEMYVCTSVADGTYTWGRVEFGAEIDDTSTEPTKVWSAEKCNQLSEEISNLQTSGMTTAQVNALDGMFKVCAFIKDDISAEYNAFCTAFGIEAATITGIFATYSGGDVSVGTDVTNLTGIVVTANYSDGSKRTVTGYTLSGTIAEGNNTITVTYEGMTTTFTVTGVSVEVTLSSISVTYSGGDVAVGTALSDLTGIVVTAHYSDGSSATVTGYTMNGTIAEGENTISVTYNGKTATFTVTGTVEHERVEHIVSGQTFPVTLTWQMLAFDVTPALATYVSGETQDTYYDVEIDVESISSENAYITVSVGGGAFVRNASDYAGQTGTLKMTGEIWHPSMSDASQIKLSCNKGTETSSQTAVITGVRIYER